MNMRLLRRLAPAAALAVMLAGCGREVDIGATGAVAVPGAVGLHRFCDGPVLIYFTKIAGQADEYDWYWPGGCEWSAASGAWVFGNKPPVGLPPNGDSTEDGN